MESLIYFLFLIAAYIAIKMFKKDCKHFWWKQIQLKKHRMNIIQKSYWEKEETYYANNKW